MSSSAMEQLEIYVNRSF